MRELLNNVGLFLGTPQVAGRIGHPILPAGGAPTAHRVLFHIGIEELVGIQVGLYLGESGSKVS
ncbi:MAG TPA: hypothetical protein PLQ35_03535 [bacterium]|nr:hypothetical protein [bacterium]HQL61345.1 hypothetical protein [bacterium]